MSSRQYAHMHPRFEELERRVLLSSAAIGPIPDNIDPATATQTLFAPGTSRWTIPASGVSSQFYRFSTDTLEFASPVLFDLAPVTNPGSGDAALALYDEQGNLLQVVDEDAGPVPGIESLTTAVESRRPYILAVYFESSGPPVDYRLRVTVDDQVINVPPQFNPATGISIPTGAHPEDILSTPADVDYYPLNLLNAGPLGTVTITETGLDITAAATLFRLNGNNTWVSIGSGTTAVGGAVVLPIIPPSDQSIADGQYMLAVASHDFASAGAYTVQVNAAPVLGPTSVSPVVATTVLGTPAPISLGIAGFDRSDSISVGGQRHYRFIALSTGPLEITLQAPGFDPLISLYDSVANVLLATASRTAPGTATMTFTATAGQHYTIRVGDVGNNHGGNFNLSLRTPYEPTPLELTGLITATSFNIGQGLPASIFRVNAPLADLLLAEANSAVGSQIVILGQDFGPISQTASGGQTNTLPVPKGLHSGPVDIYVSGTGSNGSASFRIGQLAIPKSLPIHHFTTRKLDPVTGNLPATSQSAGPFGTLSGVQFHQHVIPAFQDSALAVQGLNGARPLLVHYQHQGNTLRFVDFALPDAAQNASRSTPLGVNKVHAVAAIALNLDGLGVHQFSLDGPPLMSVGVGMVPDPPPPTWQDPPASPPFYSVLKIRDITLDFDYEQDLWHTLLPHNLITTPWIDFIPTPNAGLAATITVYKDDFTQSLTSATTAPGQPTQVFLGAQDVESLKGARILFRIEPLPGQLGDGVYTLEMTAQTTDPAPYEVREPHWRFWGSSTENPPSGIATFPMFETLKEIVQDPSGFGSYTSAMTSSLPYDEGIFGNAGSIDVFRFWAVTPGPVTVRTIPAEGSNVNTNLKLYRAVFKANGELNYITQIQDVPVSFDWYPADRSEIDAQVYVNDFDLLRYPAVNISTYHTGGGMYFAVVKNQEGSLGAYHIEVQTQPFPSLGGNPAAPNAQNTYYQRALQADTTYIPPAGGSATIQLPYTESFNEFLGYFPVQVPEYHTGTLTVTSAFGGFWTIDAFLSDGMKLPGTVTDQSAQPGNRTIGTFTVPAGPQIVYLRLGEKTPVLNANASFGVSASVQLPSGVSIPQVSQPPDPLSQRLLADPFGNADAHTDSLAASGSVKSYMFRAGAGPLTVNVTPDRVNGQPTVLIRWGVYVNGTLRTWDQTRFVNGQLVADSLTTTLLLPKLRAPLPDPDFAHDTAPHHDVQVRVIAVTNPSNGGTFSISTDAASPMPLRDLERRLIPNSTSPSISYTTTGTQWAHIYVPDRISGTLSFAADVGGGTIGIPISFEIFDADGVHIISQVVLTQGGAFGPARAFFTPPGLSGGTRYIVRVGLESNVQANVNVLAGVSTPKASDLPPLLNHSMMLQNMREAAPRPNGEFTYYNVNRPDVNHPTLQESNHFWVDRGGHAEIKVRTQGQDGYVALYRGAAVMSGEFVTWQLHLVDFTNSADPSDPDFFSLRAYVEPGMYALKVFRLRNTVSTSTPAPVEYKIPAYHVQEMILDPNFGTSNLPHLLGVYTARSSFGAVGWPLDSYRTRFYSLTAPSGTIGPMSGAGYSVGNAQELNFARISLWRDLGDGEVAPLPAGHSATIDPPSTPQAFFSGSVMAEPNDTFVFAVTRDYLATKLGLGFTFVVPFSGTPDLQVEPIDLLPDNGTTRVDVTLVNLGYAPAFQNHSMLRYTDTSKVPVGVTEAVMFEMPIGPVGSRAHTFTWVPVRPADEISFTADVFDQIEELDETNNHAAVVLSTVNAHRPVVNITLANSTLTNHPTPNTWGRYVSGWKAPGDWTAAVSVFSDIIITVTDADEIHQTYDNQLDRHGGFGRQPYLSGIKNSDGMYIFGPPEGMTIKNFDFGKLVQTAPDNPNIIRYTARDRWGLLSDEAVIKLDVAPYPAWLNDGTSTIAFNSQTRQYDFHFKNTVLEQGGTLEQLTGVGVPFIGNKENLFKAAVHVAGSASLNPNTPISAPVSGYVLMKVLGATVLEETWTGQGQINNHLQLLSNVHIEGKTIEAQQLNITFKLMELNLFNWMSPKITLFAYGVPGVASLNAYLQFSVRADVDAAITLALDPAALANPGLPKKIGLASPMYIEPSITAGLTIGGSVEVIGFDLASLSGTINFKLALAYGLTTPPSQFVPFLDFFSNSNLNITGTLFGSLKAKVLGFTVFTFDFPSVVMNLTGGPPVVKNSNLLDPLTQMAGLQHQLPELFLSNMTEPVIPGGTAPVGPMELAPSPNIVISHPGGQGRYVQVVDTDPGSEILGELAISTRTGPAAAWTPQTVLTSAGHVSNPILALTNDGANAPAVVVYQSLTPAGPISNMTRNQFLTGQNLRFRYFNGSAWSAEQNITNDSLYDFDHAVAFNSHGQGVLAWVRSTSAAPINSEGHFNRDANEIVASIWNPLDKTWSAPVALTNDSIADSKPAVYVDESGRPYVLWLKDTPSGNQVIYRTNKDGAWSVPHVLPTNGLPPDGKVGSLTIGSQQAGRINVLMSHTRTDPETGEIHSRLYSRSTTLAAFNQPAAVVEVARDATFSHLRTTNAPGGSLVAYWQHGNGLANEIYAATLAPGGAWSKPIRLSADAELSFTPSLAIDTDGTYQLVYHLEEAPKIGFWDEVPMPPPLQSPPTGIPTQGGVVTGKLLPLPEFGFTKNLHFHEQDAATSGQTAIGRATIANTGLAADQVHVQFEHGDVANPIVLGSLWVTLAPGSTYDIAYPFPVDFGHNEYRVRLTPGGGQEAISLDDNVSTATLTGRPDISITSFVTTDPDPLPGTQMGLLANVRNNSNQHIGPFTVRFYAGDPHSTLAPGVPFHEVTMSLAPFQSGLAIGLWTVPEDPANRIIAVLADADDVIIESNEFNNTRYLNLSNLPDPAINSEASGEDVSVTLLNYSGVDNVQVQTTITNQGRAAATNLRVALFWSLDDEDFEQVDQFIIPALAPGQSTNVSFTADGLAGLTGLNRYRIVVDPGMEQPDSDWTNNVGETTLLIQGLPDLAVDEFTLDPESGHKQGMPVTLRARIHNLGIATAQHIVVEVLANPAGSTFIPGYTGAVIGTIVIDQLDPLSYVDIEIPLDTSGMDGTMDLALVIDRQQMILETTTQNNVATGRAVFESEARSHFGFRINADWYIRRGSNDEVHIWMNTPLNQPPTHVYSLNEVTLLEFFGFPGNDRVTVDFTNGNPIPPGGLFFDGGPDFDELMIIGSHDSDVIHFNPGSIVVNGSTITFLSIENVIIDTRSGDDTLTVTGDVPPFTFAMGPGKNIVNLRHGTFGFDYDLGSTSENLTVNVLQSAVSFAAGQNLAGLTITDAQPAPANAPEPVVRLLASTHPASPRVMRLGALQLAPAARLDLANNGLIIDHDGSNPLHQVHQWIAAGRASGAWNGFGIMSSHIAGNSQVALGIGDNAVLGRSTFMGHTVGSNSILVRYTLGGDANLDGVVNVSDLSILAANWQQTGRSWMHGDFNFDGVVNVSDLSILAANWQTTLNSNLLEYEPLVAADEKPAAAPGGGDLHPRAPRGRAVAIPATPPRWPDDPWQRSRPGLFGETPVTSNSLLDRKELEELVFIA